MKMLPFTFRVAGKENGFLNLAHFSSNGRRSRAWTAPRWRSWRCCRSTPARVSCSRRLCTRRSRCAAPPTTGIEFHRFYWFTPLKTKVFTEECGSRVGSSWTPGRESCFRYKENHSLNCEEIVTLTVDPWGSTAPLSREAFSIEGKARSVFSLLIGSCEEIIFSQRALAIHGSFLFKRSCSGFGGK